MKLGIFFEKFEQLAGAPGAVEKMRGLVLELAVQGRLVTHSAAEPAVPYASIEDATPINVSDVPANWRVVLLADAIKNRSGNSKLIKGKLHGEPAPNRFQGFSASGADVWCDEYEHDGEAIIISAVGARCGKAFKASGKWCAIANTNIARPEPTLFDFDFAYLVLNDELFWVRGGSAQPFVKFPPSLNRHFALPPLAEQKRIVAKVDELIALCDRLKVQQQERETRHASLAGASLARISENPTPANLDFLFHKSYDIEPDGLRGVVLRLAVQGQLVVPEIEREWPKAPLGDVAALITKGSTPTSYGHSYRDSGIPFVKVENVRKGLVDHTSISEFISEETHAFLGRSQLEAGDLLFSIAGTIGKTCVVQVADIPANTNQALAIIRGFGATLDVKFLKLELDSFVSDRVKERARGGAMANVSLGDIRSLEIVIPPLAEQRCIVAKVEQLMDLVDQLEGQLVASRAVGEKLLEAVVAELTIGTRAA